jgi:hypothetical protein
MVAATQLLHLEAKPGFKLQMKQMVRRARTTGVGYVKLGFQREMELSEQQASPTSRLNEAVAASAADCRHSGRRSGPQFGGSRGAAPGDPGDPEPA